MFFGEYNCCLFFPHLAKIDHRWYKGHLQNRLSPKSWNAKLMRLCSIKMTIRKYLIGQKWLFFDVIWNFKFYFLSVIRKIILWENRQKIWIFSELEIQMVTDIWQHAQSYKWSKKNKLKWLHHFCLSDLQKFKKSVITDPC